MSVYLVDSNDMAAIADAIRQKDGTQTTMTVSQMPTRISNIGGEDFMAKRIQGTLISYTVPSTCTRIFQYSFAGSLLSSITIPNTVTEIQHRAFYGCSNLTNITLPSNLTTIGSYAFSNTGLTSISLPSSLTGLREGVFDSSDLRSVTFNSQQISFSPNIFGGCHSLTTLINFSGATCKYNIPVSCFSETALVGDINLGDSATVGNYGFDNTWSNGMLYVHLTQTDASALASSYNFSNIGFNTTHCRLVVPVGMLSDYQSAFPNHSSIMMEETS